MSWKWAGTTGLGQFLSLIRVWLAVTRLYLELSANRCDCSAVKYCHGYAVNSSMSPSLFVTVKPPKCLKNDLNNDIFMLSPTKRIRQ